jgi:hypothetical protein
VNLELTRSGKECRGDGNYKHCPAGWEVFFTIYDSQPEDLPV